VSLKLSIVTPSFNQVRFLEAAMLSVLDQRPAAAAVEYVVMDGGSTDGSAEIIQRHADRLTHWQSEKDGGQYDAVTRGFTHTTGEIMGWLNSDDLYCPWAFAVVAEIFEILPDVQWLTTTTQIRWDAAGRAVRTLHVPGYSRGGFRRGEYLPVSGQFSLGWIQQESTFWRRSLWEKAGGQIGAGYPLAGDFELWARFFQHAGLYAVETPLGGFRFHGDQKTGGDRADYLAEAERALLAHGGVRHGALGRALRRRGWLRQPASIVRHHRQSGAWRVVPVNV
jgi:glycosyltransferase involved in cell wall biosynthesis